MSSTSQSKNILSAQSLPYTQFGEGQVTFNQRRHHGKTEDSRMLSVFYIGSIVILLLCSMSCMIALYRNTLLMEQNLQLLERQIEIQSKCKNNNLQIPVSLFSRIRRVRMLRQEIRPEDCPPCETPPTNPIQPYRNPVSVLNEDPRVGKKANYTVVHSCKNPPIHVAVLKILNDPAFNGKQWTGKGSSKQSAKQSAAWDCIEKQFPDLKPQVAEEYIPSPYNPPTCNDELN